MKVFTKNHYPLKWITSQLAVGPAPRSQAHIDEIKQKGIDGVLNLCAECYDLHEIEAAAGFFVHWLPIADEDAPEVDAATEALIWLDEMLAQEKKVLVHCRFGIGRTGTMLAAWLLKQGHALEDALKMLGHTPAEPKSERQWDFLSAFSRSLGLSPVTAPADPEKEPSRLGKFFRRISRILDQDAG
jgi:hypothetical protein